MRKQTKTSKFGVSARENHDSSVFYAARLYREEASGTAAPSGKAGERPGGGTGADANEEAVPPSVLDRVICGDSRRMEHLPDRSVHLMVTSPPYNAGKEYDQDLSLAEYRDLLRAVFGEVYRKLVPGGRACVNVANLGRRPYLPLHHYLIADLFDLGFLMRGEIIWNKAASSGTSTAWGSWRSAANPTLRDVHEYILVFSKGRFDRPKQGRLDTIARDEFLEFTKSLWTFPAESARKVGHPAPFPVELPYRLIQLYTFAGEVVLDPFAGSGTTCVAALRAGRHFVGYDVNPDYVRLAEDRLHGERLRLSGFTSNPAGASASTCRRK